MKTSDGQPRIESELPELPPFALLLAMPHAGKVRGETWDDFSRPIAGAAWRGTGPDEVPILVSLDGFVIFQFDATERYSGGLVPSHELVVGKPNSEKVRSAQMARDELSYQRLEYMNAFLQSVSSGLSTVEHKAAFVQTPMNAFNHLRARKRNSGSWEVYGLSGPASEPNSALFVKPETFDHAIELLNACKKALDDDWSTVLSLIYVACHQYSLHQFSSSHLISWCVAERMLNKMWADLQSEVDKRTGGHTKMDKPRRKRLEGRDYSAAVITQVLSISNKIDDRLLQWLDEVRKARNNFAHGLGAISSDDAAKAARLATDLLGRVCKVRVTSQIAHSQWR